MPGLMKTQIKSLPFLHRGKVRDIYAVGDDKLLVVQTDRLSAFDVIMEDPIPNKGRILTAMSNFWFKKFGHLMPNHMTDIDPESLVAPHERDQVRGRAIVVKKYKAIPIEAIVRGYIIGTGWKDYQQTGAICGIKLPAGLKEAQKLPEVIFTPSTKADVGEHDQNISFEKMKEIVGAEVAEKVREMAITLYREAAEFAATKGILIADTKFEFGMDDDGKIYLIDEILTPDSSRFWPLSSYEVGMSPPSFDKQYVRDWLSAQPWDKTAPAPRLPLEVAEKTTEKYNEALRLLTA
ncbi:phosphoribosylaminoimidazolesuccinocarboxamide synthase [Oxalobacter formigenes]|uniref:Phosphoribosylaminoimidazole-succinocarboxamide synthase n=1 Tax=Oxalobacter formigenes OXCC13 TaxID=556269 RepID=C3XAE3_OXAFO|nr:phosphoribosylaminoimidazolesuccinocarboxamide synthase [Oxalobacter formigenes]ARQ45685.1 Phosphoribosylaminoimidazole-succinocarboxamide synthase [Oxalobacter formigenes]ARQ77926.1 phosphoribosylaminoimidazolesuccinocarboxamide synthase [Oxalobacter formigenes OXCC13]EEO30169.1 phosphoribosylaminoimidazolesuccinocarboxamide synthase [Oxalobacter formigenes OXCC13]MCZ4063085.1 phosphoribosylaminoimidazolesuccinocarboxamide synthase [Oxalobacter formigenes]QDX33526.1 phosphoribosylaminoimid